LNAGTVTKSEEFLFDHLLIFGIFFSRSMGTNLTNVGKQATM
jgi:hypothetical protein